MTSHTHQPGGADAWRLLGLDIDGTLLHWGGDVSDAVIAGVERVRQHRTHVILATGRNIVATLPVARLLGIKRGYAVCSNGAVTIRLNPAAKNGWDLLDVVTFDPRRALELIREEMPDAMYAVEDMGQSFRTSQEFPMNELVGEQRVVDDFDELCEGEVTRVVICQPDADIDHFDDLVQRIGLEDVTYAVGYTAWLDLTPPEVSKASALEALRQRLGVDPRDTYAVGDGHNDLQMLGWAAQSAAMGNAPQRVQEAAGEVIPSVQDDGLLTVLDRLVEPDAMARVPARRQWA